MTAALNTLTKLQQICADPLATLRDQKNRTGMKVIGCVPMHFPEEIVHAAGLQPATLLEGHERCSLADAWIANFFCQYGRSMTENGLNGSLDFLDGLIIPSTCFVMLGLVGTAKCHFTVPFQQGFWLPQTLHHPHSKTELVERLRRLQAELERIAKRPINDRALWGSIAIYNENRRMLKEIYALRRQRPGLINAADVRAVVLSSMLMLKEDHNELLSALLSELRDAPAVADSRVRLVLSGNLCCCPDVEFLEIVESVGAVVADDDLYVGSRYFATETQTSGDPLAALAEQYVAMVPPSATAHRPDRDWGEYLIQMVRASGAHGVVTLMVKNCEPHGLHVPHLNKSLAAASIPHLVLETEDESLSAGQIRTRLQAFVELVKGE